MSHSFIAERMSHIGTEAAFEVFAAAKELERRGVRVIHFELGEPDFDTPLHIKEACVRALQEGFTHYTPSTGILELKEAIAEKLRADYGVDVNPRSEVVVMPGAKPCIYTAIVVTINPGDEVIIPNPIYPIYESVVRFVGGKPVPVPLREENDFRLSPEDVAGRVTRRTRMVVLNSPSNPCGSMLSKKDVEGIAEVAREQKLIVLSDEVYSKITYEEEHHSILAEPGMLEQAIMIDGFSKTYAMTGWRLGYAVANSEVINHMVKLQINITSCPVSFVQTAAVTALKATQEPSHAMVGEYDRRRKAVVEGLNRIRGVSCRMPKGAFYAFSNVKSFKMKSKDLMRYLLEKVGVALVHGDAFGAYGEGYLRLSYATSIENIKEGLERIEEALGNLP